MPDTVLAAAHVCVAAKIDKGAAAHVCIAAQIDQGWLQVSLSL